MRRADFVTAGTVPRVRNDCVVESLSRIALWLAFRSATGFSGETRGKWRRPTGDGGDLDLFGRGSNRLRKYSPREAFSTHTRPSAAGVDLPVIPATFFA